MLPRYQHIVNEVQDLGDGRALLTFDEAFLKHYRPETERAVAVGNLICLEVSPLLNLRCRHENCLVAKSK